MNTIGLLIDFLEKLVVRPKPHVMIDEDVEYEEKRSNVMIPDDEEAVTITMYLGSDYIGDERKPKMGEIQRQYKPEIREGGE